MSLEGFINMLLYDQERSWRKDVFNTKVKDIEIDTCFAPDTGQWETAINRDGVWIVVEMYGNDREKAKKGHDKWVEKITKNPKMELKECLDPADWADGNY